MFFKKSNCLLSLLEENIGSPLDESELFKAELEAFPDGLLVVDKGFKTLHFNRNFLKLWGIQDDVKWGRNCDNCLQHIAMKTRDPRGFTERVEYLMENLNMDSRDEIELADGKTYEQYTSPLIDRKGNPSGRIWFFRDITPRRQVLEKKRLELENQARNLEKLESLRTMSAAIAHNFNNLLTVILGNIELALKATGDKTRFLNKCQSSALQAANISRRLLLYLGNDPTELKEIDGSIELERIIKELSADLPPNTRINLSIQGPVRIRSNRALLKEVLTCLVHNSIEAMWKDGGQIWVELAGGKDMQKQGKFCPIGSPDDPAGYCCIAVSDNGEGIDQDELYRIFDPFYTSKMIGRGLGLSIVQGIMAIHDGTVCIQSRPHEGTTVLLYFPMVHERGKLPF